MGKEEESESGDQGVRRAAGSTKCVEAGRTTEAPAGGGAAQAASTEAPRAPRALVEQVRAAEAALQLTRQRREAYGQLAQELQLRGEVPCATP